MRTTAETVLLLSMQHTLSPACVSALMQVMKRRPYEGDGKKLRLGLDPADVGRVLRKHLGRDLGRVALQQAEAEHYSEASLAPYWNEVLGVSAMGCYDLHGSHYLALGYTSPLGMYQALTAGGEHEQFAAYLRWVMRSIEAAGALRREDWGGAARLLPHRQHYHNLSADLANAWLGARVQHSLQDTLETA